MLRKKSIVAVCALGLFFTSQSGAVQKNCNKFSVKSESDACKAVLATSESFFKLLRAKVPDSARESKLHTLYHLRFARMKIARTLVVKVYHRGTWGKINAKVRERIAYLGGQFILKQIIYGRFGEATRASNEVTVTVNRVEVRRRDAIVYSTVRGTREVDVRWYLTRDLKVFNIYLSAPFPSYMLNTYTSHIARLAHSLDRFILYRMRSEYPGEALVNMLQDLIKGGVEINPHPDHFR